MMRRPAALLPALPLALLVPVAALVVVVALALGGGPFVSVASADEGSAWHLEQPLPPELPSGQKASTPIGLGRIGDIEFWGPNRGLLITAGNPPTIPPGVWVYNGVSWHELASVCGATDGRIAWAGPDEFWTVSDGRPGQASIEGTPPLEDNTLCHFANGAVVGSYASLAFRPNSYQAMHGAACLGPADCWFGGDALPQNQVGAFHLHWDGHSLNAQPAPQGHAVEGIRRYGGLLYEGVRLNSEDLLSEEEAPTEPSDLHVIEPAGVQPTFVSLFPGVPTYSSEEVPQALDFLHLSADETALWGAADPVLPTPTGSTPSEVTVLRFAGGLWQQILGPSDDPGGENPFTKVPGEERNSQSKNETVNSIAAEPPGAAEAAGGAESAWLALTSGRNAAQDPVAPALVARLASDGTVTERQSLPSAEESLEGVGPKGSAEKVACPAPHDCWVATSQGWLFHLTTPAGRAAELQAPDTDPAFNGPLITFRPPDAGIPPVVPDAPPVDNSGLPGEASPLAGTLLETPEAQIESRVAVPLLSNIRTHLVHGTMLVVSFHLAVQARLRLIAKRKKQVVASTRSRTFTTGNRKLTVRLSRKRWPTKLDLQSRALAPLPTVSTKGSGAASNSVSTAFHVLPRTGAFAGLGPVG
jgi:hypothetical protein